MPTRDELSGALIDVRKAYRLLYVFQRRILDLVEQLSAMLGQKFYYWLPAGDAEAIRGADNPFEKNTWKMLPMFNASFLFLPPGASSDAPLKGQWLLEVILYDDGEPEGGRGEPDPAEFADPLASHSMIYLCAFIVQEDMQKNWYHGLYNVSRWPAEDGVAETRQGCRVVGLSIDLATLPDCDALENSADRFRGLITAEGGLVSRG